MPRSTAQKPAIGRAPPATAARYPSSATAAASLSCPASRRARQMPYPIWSCPQVGLSVAAAAPPRSRSSRAYPSRPSRPAAAAPPMPAQTAACWLGTGRSSSADATTRACRQRPSKSRIHARLTSVSSPPGSVGATASNARSASSGLPAPQ